MLRRTITAVAVSTVLALGLLAGAPTAGSATAYDNSIGIVTAPNQTWHKYCAKYTIRWRFTPPTDQWTAVARFRSPRGFAVRTEFWDSNSTTQLGHRSGTKKIELCGSSVKPGRYRIEMQMIYDEGRDKVTKKRRPTFFRLIRR